MSHILPAAFQKHLDILSLLTDWEERYGYIIDLGKTHKALPDEVKIPENLVRGCTSQVWLVLGKNTINGGTGVLHMEADSDALIVRGLLALLQSAFDGQTLSEIKPKSVLNRLEEVGLLSHLSMNRRNGLSSVLARIEAFLG